MDPVSVFNALYDTKCIKFGQYDLKSGLVAPYYINLRRLPLYPALMNAIVTQVYERFLSPQALTIAVDQVRKRRENRSTSTASQIMESINQELKKTLADLDQTQEGENNNNNNNHHQKKLKSPSKQQEQHGSTDSDSQLGEDEGSKTSSDASGEWADEITSATCNDPIISGVPYGAIPLATAIAYKANLPFLFERKGPKTHGDQQAVMEEFDDETRRGAQPARNDDSVVVSEGHDKTRQHQVILIEDVICSGESILKATRRLEQQNLKVEFVICIVDREENGAKLLLQEAGIRVLSLYKISAILRVLEVTGRISSKHFITIRQWIGEHQFRSIGVDPTEKKLDEGDKRRDTPAVQAGDSWHASSRACAPLFAHSDAHKRTA